MNTPTTLTQERILATEIPGPRSQALRARKVSAVSAGIGTTLPVYVEQAGGGILRDLLAGRTPVVLREDVYALPALAGATVVVLTSWLGWYAWWVGLIAALVCIVLRGLAIVFRWQAPRPGRVD